MRIAEIFYSLQGEGVLTGVPSVFVRTSGCNLRCTWCDTPYASWHPEGDEVAIEQIVTEVQRHPARHVVITGGEPMIAKGIHELLQALRTAGYHITIETAGTVRPGGACADLASISPKLSNSSPDLGKAGQGWVDRHEALRLQPGVLREWCSAYPFQLKFVIAAEADLEEAREVVEAIGIPVPAEQVLLMPEGTTTAAMQERTGFLIAACKRYGYRLSPRLHIDWFGNQRGT